MKTRNKMQGGSPAPNKPEKDIPVKPDENPDPTKPKPGGNEPEKNDPTRIEEPKNPDPTRIDEPQPAKQEPGKTALKAQRQPINRRVKWTFKLGYRNTVRIVSKTLAFTH